MVETEGVLPVFIMRNGNMSVNILYKHVLEVRQRLGGRDRQYLGGYA